MLLELANATLSLGMALPPALFWWGALFMVGTGFVDDIYGLNFKQKLLLQVIVAYMLLHAGFRFDLASIFSLQDPYQEALFSIPLTLVWIVGVINAVNLVDGLDGLAGGIVLIGLASLAIAFGWQSGVGSTVVAVVMIGAITGFLFYNFNPASVFMGDSGSLLLGYSLAAFSLTGHYDTAPFHKVIVPIVALGLPVLDANLSILRRISRGVAVCAPDKDHIHHRLRARFSVRRTVLMLYAAAAVFGLLAILITLLPVSATALLLMGGVVIAAVGLYALDYIRVRPIIHAMRKLGRKVTAPYMGERMLHSMEVPSGVEAHHVVMSDGHYDDAREMNAGDGTAHDRLPLIAHDRLPSIAGMEESSTTQSVVATSNCLTAMDLDGEKVIFNPYLGSVHSLTEVEADVLDLIQEPIRVDDVVDLLKKECVVNPEQLSRIVLSLLRSMEEKGVIQFTSAPARRSEVVAGGLLRRKAS